MKFFADLVSTVRSTPGKYESTVIRVPPFINTYDTVFSPYFIYESLCVRVIGWLLAYSSCVRRWVDVSTGIASLS